ncbi:ethylbenzene dehydrogenase-related protein [Sulfurihydrogenibium azorense]|uniref:ethylbenzene dehydrogenase-related protein n=1 Tax=Sulfurihydrogenibium azorense TaxID=309806 RepID=UPI00240A54D7|nr:c-type cytochrome [Sulfurihydrogenibium azorense]MDM7273960.1 c-type cytochrome [Sulfurihydrogenibium azorense]
MKKALSLLALSTLVISSNAGVDKFEDDVIEAKQIANISEEGLLSLPTKKITLYQQYTVALNDANAKKLVEEQKPVEAEVAVGYNQKEIGILIKWKDETKSVQPAMTTNKYGDGVSVQFPIKYGKGTTLAYIGMGDSKHPVMTYLKKAVEGKDYQKAFIAEGFGSLTEIQEKGYTFTMKYDDANKQWIAFIKKPIKTPDLNLASGMVPVSFAIWDGNSLNRDGNKVISNWKFIKMGNAKVDPNYLKYISWGYGEIGNPARGKELMIQNGCNGCHRFADQTAAPEGLAPNLSKIGGYSNPAYLKESIVNPNDVVIRNLNINRHYNKAAGPDKNGAYPNNDMYTWYIKDDKGNITSKMPPYAHLSEQDLKDMVAYLKTLK